MSTHITLEDGRVVAVSNGQFDVLIEDVASELERASGSVPNLSGWLLEQRCEVLGPGVGYLDLRELSPLARRDFRHVCHQIHQTQRDSAISKERGVADWMMSLLDKLVEMWASMDRGEPHDARTYPHYILSPPSNEQLGPGW